VILRGGTGTKAAASTINRGSLYVLRFPGTALPVACLAWVNYYRDAGAGWCEIFYRQKQIIADRRGQFPMPSFNSLSRPPRLCVKMLMRASRSRKSLGSGMDLTPFSFSL
jgi:hypothetical protein